MKTNIILPISLLCFILITSFQLVYGQKNTIKGFIVPPIFPSNKWFFGSLSLGYERLITKNSSASLILNIWTGGVNNNQYEFENLLLEYRKYIRNEKSILLNNSYGGIYSIMSLNHVSLNGGCKGNDDGRDYSGTHLGLGITVGKKFYLTKNKRISLDFGAGTAITYFIYSSSAYGPGCSRGDDKAELKWIPRLVFLIGYNFGEIKSIENENSID